MTNEGTPKHSLFTSEPAFSAMKEQLSGGNAYYGLLPQEEAADFSELAPHHGITAEVITETRWKTPNGMIFEAVPKGKVVMYATQTDEGNWEPIWREVEKRHQARLSSTT